MQNVALKIEEPMLLSVLYLGYLVEVPPTYLTPGNHGRGADPVGKGHAGYGGVEWYDRSIVTEKKNDSRISAVHFVEC